MKDEKVERPSDILILINDDERTGDIDDFIFQEEAYRCSER